MYITSLLATVLLAFQSFLVIDGDTLVIQGQRLRLACIDAPERSQPRGPASRHFLTTLLQQPGPLLWHTIGTDPFNRQIVLLYKNRQNVNLLMVGSGHAFVHPSFISSCPAPVQHQLRTAETMARLSKLNIWADQPPQFPWLFRATH